MCYIAFRQRHRAQVNPVLPVIGIIGSAGFLPLMFWHLYCSEPEIVYTVLILTAVIITIEVFYFERELLVEKIEEQLQVVKKGFREPFDRHKLEQSLMKAGVSIDKARKIASIDLSRINCGRQKNGTVFVKALQERTTFLVLFRNGKYLYIIRVQFWLRSYE